jgi:hypothetical protein
MKTAGFLILFGGFVLLGIGVYSSLSEREHVVREVTGRETENVMCYIIGGLALIIGGGALALSNINKKE